MLVEENKVVCFWFRLFDRDGILIEDKTEGLPVIYLHGAGQFDTALQKELEGASQGERRSFILDERMMPGRPTCSCTVYIGKIRDATELEKTLGYPVEVPDACDSYCVCHAEPINN